MDFNELAVAAVMRSGWSRIYKSGLKLEENCFPSTGFSLGLDSHCIIFWALSFLVNVVKTSLVCDC